MAEAGKITVKLAVDATEFYAERDRIKAAYEDLATAIAKLPELIKTKIV